MGAGRNDQGRFSVRYESKQVDCPWLALPRAHSSFAFEKISRMGTSPHLHHFCLYIHKTDRVYV